MERRAFLGQMARGLGGAATAGILPSLPACGRLGQPGPKLPKEKPNFLFILIDDLGWADLGCYGSTFHETPNIDRLAAQGMRFTDAYAACPVCSPTRASILTGKYPATVNLTDFIPGHPRPWAKLRVPKFNQQLPLEEATIPEALKRAGYVSACMGKWHLGGKGFGPAQQGFDVVFPGVNNHDKKVRSLTDAAIRFIEENRDKPFFLYLAHHSVHIPIEARPELVKKYEAKLEPGQKFPQQANPRYAAMLEDLDHHTGRLIARLDQLGLGHKTVVVFYSDNGGLIRIFTGKGEITTSNAPLRSEKGTLYEGGIRVPLIVRWPGVVEPKTVCNVPVTSPDFYPTFLELARLGDLPGHRSDGESIVPLITQSDLLRRDAIFWHYPHYHHSTPAGAIRQGDMKLIEFFEDGRLELYDLKADIGETKNLAGAMPEKAKALRTRLARWRESVGAKMPNPNPDYDPKRAGEWGHRQRRPRR